MVRLAFTSVAAGALLSGGYLCLMSDSRAAGGMIVAGASLALGVFGELLETWFVMRRRN